MAIDANVKSREIAGAAKYIVIPLLFLSLIRFFLYFKELEGCIERTMKERRSSRDRRRQKGESDRSSMSGTLGRW